MSSLPPRSRHAQVISIGDIKCMLISRGQSDVLVIDVLVDLEHCHEGLLWHLHLAERLHVGARVESESNV
jgi:hypothetical protein